MPIFQGGTERAAQPYIPYVDIMIGKYQLIGGGNLPAQHSDGRGSGKAGLVSFRNKRSLGEQLSEVEFTILDPTYDTIEPMLMTMGRDKEAISFQYGFEGENVRSQRYSAYQPVGWTPRITSAGLEITVTAVAGIYSESKPDATHKTARGFTRDRFTKTWTNKSLKEIYEEIASDYHLTLDLQPIKDNKVRTSGLDVTRLGYRTYYQDESDAAFIARTLKDAATAENGLAGYEAHIDVAKNLLVIGPLKMGQRFGHGIREYTFWGDKLSDVISFEVDFPGELKSAVAAGAGELSSTFFDTITGKAEEFRKGIKEGTGKQNISNPGGVGFDARPATNPHDQSTMRTIQAGRPTIKIHATNNEAVWYAAFSMIHEAKMTTIGQPFAQPNEQINVHIFLPNGHFHYTSGLYFVYEIEDVIENGTYVSNFSLLKNTWEYPTKTEVKTEQ